MDVANRPLHLTKLYEGHERSRASFAMYLAKTFAARAGLTSWEGVRILDLGCGNGNIARLFASLGAHVTGVECDLGRVSGILREQPNFNVIAADGHNLPLDDKSFDFVILSDVLEHAYDPARMLREVARVIRPGGMAYIGATNRTSFVNIMFDPHYNAPLIPLMSKRVATWYVTRFLKFSNTSMLKNTSCEVNSSHASKRPALRATICQYIKINCVLVNSPQLQVEKFCKRPFRLRDFADLLYG